MNRKIRKIVAVLTAGLLIIVLLGITNSFVGNPITKSIATKKVWEYVIQNYANMDIEISNAEYNFKFGSYEVDAYSTKSADTHFGITYQGGEISDDYQTAVVERFNTWERLNNAFTKQVESILEKDLPYEVNMVLGNLGKGKGVIDASVLELDMPYDLDTLPLDKGMTVYLYTENPTWEELAKAAIHIDELLRNNGIEITTYSLSLSKKKEDHAIDTISAYEYTPEVVRGDKVAETLQTQYSEYKAEPKK